MLSNRFVKLVGTEPGTVFRLEKDASFLIFGTFISEGLPEKQIVFDRATASEEWGNIKRCDETGPSD